MRKALTAAKIREIASSELVERVRLIQEEIGRTRLNNETFPGRTAAPVKELKKEAARILTIMRERQLDLDGMQKKVERLRESPRRLRAPRALLQAKVIGDKYPLLVGKEYRLVLRRSRPLSQLRLDYSPLRTPGSKMNRSVTKQEQSEYVIRLFSKRLIVGPDNGEREKDNRQFAMGKRSLSLRLTPQVAGECDLDVFVYSKDHLLQLLRLSFPAEAEGLAA